MSKPIAMIRFEASVSKIGAWTILKLPKSASAKLPSRGMVMGEGTINGFSFQAPLEPDGKGSHWFKIEDTMHKAARVRAGDRVMVMLEPMKEWPEPHVPQDLKRALAADRKVQALWEDITPTARWDWTRWIRSTKNPHTRKIRIKKTVSKLKDGKRAACCFNRSECTDLEVSSKGVLLESL